MADREPAGLTRLGRWLEPGRPRWWDATPATRAGYLDMANSYLDALPADHLVVSVSCHA